MTRRPRPTELLVLARYPEPGAVKTRLVPALGERGAAALHDRLARQTLRTAVQWAAGWEAGVQLWYTGADAAAMGRWMEAHAIPSGASARPELRPQPVGDLGARLEAAFAAAHAGGARAALAIGTDCPALDADVLDRAHAELATADAVIGPAADGGYYLIGLRRPAPDLFRGVAWGTATVLETTRARAAAAGLVWSELPVLRDVDRPEDLDLVPHMLDGGAAPRGRRGEPC